MKRNLLFVSLLLLFIRIYGQTGTLDHTFNSTGWKGFHFQVGNVVNDAGYSLLQQSDGKYIALDKIDDEKCRLLRINSNGTIDSSYGVDGYSVPGLEDVGNAALQSDNKVVIVGRDYPAAVIVARFKTDGTLDSSFGINGIDTLKLDFLSSPSIYVNPLVAINKSDEIVVACAASGNLSPTTSFSGWMVSRLKSSGELDDSFNPGGAVPGVSFIELTSSGYPFIGALAMQGDDKILIGGYSRYNSTVYDCFTLARITNDGNIDESFGSGGIVKSFFGSYSSITSLAVQDDNKILAGGGVAVFHPGTGLSNNDFVLIRYLNDGSSDGTPDPSFNEGASITGTVFTDMGNDEYIKSIATRNDRIVLLGTSKSYNSSTGITSDTIAIAVYNNNGLLVNSFGNEGKLLSSITEQNEANSVLLLSDGGLLIAGEAYNPTVDNMDVLLVRYTSVGLLDQTFNETGVEPGVLTSWFSFQAMAIATAVAVQPDGKIVVAGFTQQQQAETSNILFAAARFNPDGMFDNNFGNNGVALANFQKDGYGAMATPYCIAIAPVTGKIVVAGSVNLYDPSGEQQNFALAQFTKQGILDNSFGTRGVVITDFENKSDEIYAIAIQSNGYIVAGGRSVNDADAQDFQFARYTTSGSLDSTFGINGVVAYDFMGLQDQLTNLAIQNDGKIVAVGAITNSSTNQSNLGILRLMKDGSLDRKFAKTGQTTSSFPGVESIGSSLAIQPDGKILVSGVVDVYRYNTSYSAILRYSNLGVLDTTFGNGGIASVTFDGYNISIFGFIRLNNIDLQSDGKILLSFTLQGGSNNDIQTGIARFSSNGSLDDSWGTNGKLVTDIKDGTLITSSAWNNNRLYITGVTGIPNEEEILPFIAAYITRDILPAVSVDDKVVTQNVGTVTLTVTLNKSGISPITVNYATQDNTASSKGKHPDYKSTRGSVTMLPGELSATLAIPIYANDVIQNDKSFFVNLSLSSQMSKLVSLEKATGIVTITYGPIGPGYTKLNTQDNEQKVTGNLVVKAMPNPSTNAFTIELQSPLDAPATIRIIDITGRLIESRTGIAPNSRLQVGYNYKPGAYYAEVLQGNEKVIVKLVKQ